MRILLAVLVFCLPSATSAQSNQPQYPEDWPALSERGASAVYIALIRAQEVISTVTADPDSVAEYIRVFQEALDAIGTDGKNLTLSAAPAPTITAENASAIWTALDVLEMDILRRAGCRDRAACDHFGAEVMLISVDVNREFVGEKGKRLVTVRSDGS